MIAEGFIPAVGPHADDPTLRSHETASIANAGSEDAEITITILFSDREPAGPYHLTVPARRTRHVRFDELGDPESIPRETDYASIIVSTQPVVVQHSRLDSRSGTIALLSAAAYAEG